MIDPHDDVVAEGGNVYAGAAPAATVEDGEETLPRVRSEAPRPSVSALWSA